MPTITSYKEIKYAVMYMIAYFESAEADRMHKDRSYRGSAKMLNHWCEWTIQKDISYFEEGNKRYNLGLDSFE